ncbi:MAG: TlpA family protein disulfide reductase [Deltaproteobacteria bacterium]|nr:MAG: TlpA family protein disulfide reductase [Deltaproteobacteria bacterium]
MRQRSLRAGLLLAIGMAFGVLAQDSDVFILREHTPAQALAGKVAVLSFGATWCSSCTSELKSLENLQAKFPKDLTVYFVAMDGRGEKDVKPYLEKHGHKIRTLLDPQMEVARRYGVRWLPVTVVRDRKGVIVGRAIGAREWDGKEALAFIQPLTGR